MLAKLFDEYQRLSEKAGFVSKLGAFLISIFTILSLYDIFYFLYFSPSGLKNFFEIHGLFSAVIFHALILMVFAARFVLLFFKTRKFFYFNQILWLIGLTLLAVYWFISRPVPGPFTIYSTFPDPIFSHASQMFDSVGISYLLLSLPVKFLTLIIALIKSK